LKIQRAIESQEKIIQSLRDLKKSTMQHVFTRGLRGEKTKMTEIGEIPASWEVYPLSELREFLQYGTSKRCTLDRKGVAVLRIPNIVGGKIDTQELKYADLPSAKRERLILQDGDILFVRTNGQKIFVGRTSVYKGNPSPSLFASYLIRARLQLKLIRPDFVQYYTETVAGAAQLSGRATPAADGKFNINTKTIDSVLVPVPDCREQDKIVQTIDLVARKLVVQESKQSALKDLSRSALNKLMTGEIRVQDLEIDISEVN
jgi:type I restriction enzyme S subunit